MTEHACETGRVAKSLKDAYKRAWSDLEDAVDEAIDYLDAGEPTEARRVLSEEADRVRAALSCGDDR